MQNKVQEKKTMRVLIERIVADEEESFGGTKGTSKGVEQEEKEIPIEE